MNKNLKIILGIVITFLLIVGALFGYKALTEKDKVDYTELTVQEIKQKISDKESFILVIGSAECGACKAFNPTIQSFMAGKSEPIYHLEMTLVDEADYDFILNTLNAKQTPTTLFFIQGEMVGTQVGNITRGELKTLFDQYRKIIDSKNQAQ